MTLVAVAATGGRAGLVDHARRLVRWHVPARWWAVAVGLPLAFAGGATVVGAGIGGTFHLGETMTLSASLVYLAYGTGMFLLTEESAWRGFALPRLMRHRSSLAAALVLGVIWSCWHLPIFATSTESDSVIPWPGSAALCVLHVRVLLIRCVRAAPRRPACAPGPAAGPRPGPGARAGAGDVRPRRRVARRDRGSGSPPGDGFGAQSPELPGPRHTDLAGEVITGGAGASRFVPGDRVFGETTRANYWGNAGTFAEFAAVDETLLARIPENLSFEETATVPTAALIALTNLHGQGRVEAGQRVLVNGAGGAVGVWVVQLAKAFGAEVTAIDSGPKLDLLRHLGADHVVDYTEQDFTRMGLRYDLVVDIVSHARFSEIRRALEPDETFVLVGHDQYGRSGHRFLGSLGRMLPLLAISPFVKQLPGIRPGPSRQENWATIVELLGNGRIRPVVDERVFPLEQAAEAIDYLATGTAKGRVVLTVG
ncbi:MAG: zinc-binding dehydrogenase [Kineosporiaceae bacterium]